MDDFYFPVFCALSCSRFLCLVQFILYCVDSARNIRTISFFIKTSNFIEHGMYILLLLRVKKFLQIYLVLFFSSVVQVYVQRLLFFPSPPAARDCRFEITIC
jgi:hypothetical protein